MLTILKSTTEILRGPTRLLNCLPFFHAMALILHVCLPVHLLGTTHIQVPFEPTLFLEVLKNEKIEVSLRKGPPSILSIDF